MEFSVRYTCFDCDLRKLADRFYGRERLSGKKRLGSGFSFPKFMVPFFALNIETSTIYGQIMPESDFIRTKEKNQFNFNEI